MSNCNPFQTTQETPSLTFLVDYFKIPKVQKKKIQPLSSPLLPYSYCKKNEILPFEVDGNEVHVAVSDPFNLNLEAEVSFILSKFLKIHFCPKDELLLWIDEAFHHEKGAASQLIKNLSESSGEEEQIAIYDLLDQSKDSPSSIKLLNFLIQEAVSLGASDMHFEPVEDTFRIRYRIDGVLQNRHKIPSHYKSNIISRLKVMAKLDIAEMRRPQDGRIKLKSGNKEIDFRVSTIPIANGERIVLRILDKSNLMLGFDHLGMDLKTLESFQKMIRKSEGLVLVTGPTGSGKTTTLYSAVSEISNDSLNIMTIEDPVEYKLFGISQMSVQPKINLTFSKGLRHILRQDPDVILIGEVRDLETAQIAIQSALTGHLVLSTLHTNDASSAITRLVDMGIEPYLLSSCIVGVLAQRLLRTLCPKCKEKATPLEKDLKALGLQSSDTSIFYQGRGCSSCHETGYSGRVGIYELMPMTANIKKQVSLSSNSADIKEIAQREGLVTLKDQGLHLASQGITSLSEVLRVALGMEDG